MVKATLVNTVADMGGKTHLLIKNPHMSLWALDRRGGSIIRQIRNQTDGSWPIISIVKSFLKFTFSNKRLLNNADIEYTVVYKAQRITSVAATTRVIKTMSSPVR